MNINMHSTKNDLLYFSYSYNVDRWKTFFHYWVILNVYMGSFLIFFSLYLYLLPIELLLYIICRKGHLGFKPFINEQNNGEMKANLKTYKYF